MKNTLKRINPKIILSYLALTLLLVLAVGPFLWLLSTALKSDGENLFQYPPQFIPEEPTLANFIDIFNKVPMASYFFNSIVVTLLTVFFNLLFSVLAAYPLARMQFKGQKAILMLILSTMMIPFQVIMVPLYFIMLKLHLTDASGIAQGWIGLVIPFAVSGFGIFFVRQALVTLPKDLEESAVLDGCNSADILFRVLLPLIQPTLATLAVFTFMATWGEFLWPSIILNEPGHFTLPVGLVQLQGAFSANWRLIAAGTLLSTLPVLVFFIVLQKYFVAGALSGSVKG
jgi:putative chitobiose transport system permease protein